mmetsp:Transcript_39008/g.111650  ORF Transcript_39008/g.111650 Transcript_39008/m.111650 type:complete len:143 (+) Transcript_39008:1137-1565(+)
MLVLLSSTRVCIQFLPVSPRVNPLFRSLDAASATASVAPELVEVSLAVFLLLTLLRSRLLCVGDLAQVPLPTEEPLLGLDSGRTGEPAGGDAERTSSGELGLVTTTTCSAASACGGAGVIMGGGVCSRPGALPQTGCTLHTL